jgi:hypothetical protein
VPLFGAVPTVAAGAIPPCAVGGPEQSGSFGPTQLVSPHPDSSVASTTYTPHRRPCRGLVCPCAAELGFASPRAFALSSLMLCAVERLVAGRRPLCSLCLAILVGPPPPIPKSLALGCVDRNYITTPPGDQPASVMTHPPMQQLNISGRRVSYGLLDQPKPTTLLPPGARGNACNGRLCGAAGGANLSPSTQGGASRWLIPHRSTDRKHR